MELFKATTPEKDTGICDDSNYFNSSDFSRVLVKKNDIETIKLKRGQEKQILGNLNQQFMSYLDKVKYLEITNINLLNELKELRTNWGKETRTICELYEPKLLDTRAMIDDFYIKNCQVQICLRKHEQTLNEAKYKHDEALAISTIDKNKILDLENQLKENHAQLDFNKTKQIDLQNDIAKYKNEIENFNKDIENLLIDLEKEMLSRIKLENEKQTLEEQIPFLKAIHDKMINEMQLLQSISSQIDPKIFFTNELDRAVREIRNEFENLNKQQKIDMEEWYKYKAQEMINQSTRRDEMDSLSRAESTSSLASSLDLLKNNLNEGQRELSNLKQENANLIMRLNQMEESLDRVRRDNSLTLDKQDSEINELREDLKDLLSDHDELMNNKIVLEFEINTYHRLLGSEQKRNMLSTSIKEDKAVVVDNEFKAVKTAKQTKVAQQVSKINAKVIDKLAEETIILNKTEPTVNIDQTPAVQLQSSTQKQMVTSFQEEVILKKKDDDPVLMPVAKIPDIMLNKTQENNSVVLKKEDNLTGSKSQSGEYRIITSETKSKTTFQRSAKGPISICECSPDGKVIIIENTSKNKDISLSNWEILRRVDSKDEIRYKFPNDLILKPNKIVRIWSGCVSSTELLPTDLINLEIDDWGIGEYVITVLLNDAGNEKATHLQKTVFNQIGA